MARRLFQFFRAEFVFRCLFVGMLAGCFFSTDTENASTDTDNAIKVSRVDFKPGRQIEELSLNEGVSKSEDGAAIDMDSNVTLIFADVMSSDNTANYVMTTTDTIYRSAYTQPVFIIEKDTLTNVTIINDVKLTAQIVGKDNEPLTKIVANLRNSNSIPGVYEPEAVNYDPVFSDTKGIITWPKLGIGKYVILGKSIIDQKLLFFENVTLSKPSANQFRPITVETPKAFIGVVRRMSGLTLDSIRVFITGTDMDIFTDESGRFDFGVIPPNVPDVGFELYKFSGTVTSNCPVKDYGQNRALEIEAVKDTTAYGLTRWTIEDLDYSNCSEK